MSIAAVEASHYSIPLSAVLTDSTHGAMASFELVTARLRTVDGAEGVGYTYTVGAGGAAIAALINRDLQRVLLGAEIEEGMAIAPERPGHGIRFDWAALDALRIA